MKTVELSSRGTILLPKGLFKPSEKVVLFTRHNMVIIKKLESPRLSWLARRAKGRAPSLREISREVHAYRRAKRTS